MPTLTFEERHAALAQSRNRRGVHVGDLSMALERYRSALAWPRMS